MKYYLKKAKSGEEEIVYKMIKDRVSWMDDNDIHQWNDTNYLEVYPSQYYKDNIDNLYVLTDDKNIFSAAILLREDPRWNSNEPSIYIHNFVSSLNGKGTGTIFIEKLIELAKQEEISYLRLDSAKDNTKLENYYAKLGFKPCGTCIDGSYHGILREKKI